MLPQLLEKRAARIGRMRALLDGAQAAGRDLSEAEQTEYTAAETEVRGLNTQIERAQRLDAMERAAHATPVNGGTGLGDFDAECRSFSLLRAIAGISGMQGVDYAREREISQELARRMGRNPEGIFAPQNVLHVPRNGLERRVVVSSTTGAGAVGTDHRDDQLVDALRAATVVNALGATVLNGLVGNVSIPAIDTGGTAAWIAENGALSPVDWDINSRTLTPKHVGCLTEFSRNMILQSSPDVENMARRDFARALASAFDSAAIYGGQSNEPSGIIDRLNDVSGLGTWAGPTWAQGLALIADVERGNALSGSLGWAVHPDAKKKLRSTVRVSSTDSQFIMDDPTTLYGYQALATAHAALSTGSPGSGTVAAVFGDWTSLVIGYWGGVDVLANPYETTAYTKGNVQVRGLLSADVSVRHLESFAAAVDMPRA